MAKTQTRVAILATSEKTQQRLSSLLEEAGLNVVAHELPGDGFLTQLENASPDVLLVDLSEENGSETDIIDTLLDYDALPIFFNDSSPAGGGANAVWAKKLARKLSDIAFVHNTQADTQSDSLIFEEPAIADTRTAAKDSDAGLSLQVESVQVQAMPAEEQPVLQASVAENGSFDQFESIVAAEPEPEEPETDELIESIDTDVSEAAKTLPKADGAAINIWVLGASLGGPQAVRQFLAAIDPELPVAFILAQHIGANHISLLAEQLNRVTPFNVLSGRSGHLIRHHEVVLAPADKNIAITEDGYLSLLPADENAIYSPSIDNVMTAVATRYGNMAGTIVFSGMGDDGARGCESIAQHGGIIWAQDVDSCVISSMPDQARKTNTVTFSANPRDLADRLFQYYANETN